MTLAGTTRRSPIGTAVLAVGAFLILALATVGTANAQCSVPNCTTCVQEPICTGCAGGYGLNVGANTCNDINECATNGGGCAVGTATCTNTPGSRTCTCNAGYAGPGTVCNDVNECATNNGGCSAAPPVACTNTAGSYSCGACPGGYSGNGSTCTDINECAIANGGCAPTGGTCTNTTGSSSCTCNTGYSGNGFTCNDINECATNNGGCSAAPPVSCTNTAGSRSCGACPSGYAGNGVTCGDVNECATGTACGPGSCSNGTGTFTCTCPAGVSGATCDINGYVPPDKSTGKCESAVASNVAKYVKCVLKCRQQKADKALADKAFDEQACASGPKGCRAAYDKKVADLIAKGDCPACLGDVAQGLLADDVRTSVTDVKGRAYCDGTVPLAP